MSSASSAGIFGALVAIAYVLILINGNLIKLAREIERMREDNAAWRENLWKRDSGKSG